MGLSMGGLGVALLVFPLAAWGSEAVPAGTPPEVEVGSKTLNLNGAAVMRKFVFDVYAVSLYLEQPTHDGREAMRSDQEKQIHLKMLRSASSDQIAGALREGIRAGGADLTGLQERIETLLGAIPDLHSGDTLDITYVPGAGTTLSRGKRGMTLPGKDFADALFSVWLGADPKMARVKAGLLGR